jgi:hypothetical protein
LSADSQQRGLEFADAPPEVVRVIRAILPVFTHESDRPERVGTCILVELQGHAFILTAAHVVHHVQSTTRRFTVAIGGELIAVHRDRFVTRQHDAADIGLIPLRPEVVKVFLDMGGAFLDEASIDETEQGDGTDFLNSLTWAYFAVGFPASRSQSRIQHTERKIHVKTYSVRLTLAPTNTFPAGLSKEQHLLLDYDPREILLEGRSVNPPMVQGMSGGGIFRFRRRQPETTKLVGVLIERHKNARVLAGTRAGLAMSLARDVMSTYPHAFR